MAQDNQQSQGTPGIKQQTRTTTDVPRRYRVVMHNDDVTTMDFVVEVLETVFRKSTAEATTLMLQIHTGGRSLPDSGHHQTTRQNTAHRAAQ